jgi:hypothetical protein
MASVCLPRTKVTSVMPGTPRNLSAGTFLGPGLAPGARGNAVEQTVWNVTLPSTRCIVEGYNWICGRRDAMNFCASSDLNTAELGEFARLLQN